MAASVFDHSLTALLFAGSASAPFLSAQAEIAALIEFETALALSQAEAGLIPGDAAARIATVLSTADPDIPALAEAFSRDGVSIPGLLSQLRPLLSDADRPFLHFGATSQDAMDTGLMLRLKAALKALQSGLDQIDKAMDGLTARFGDRGLMGYTRMQAARPITVGHRLANWRDPLSRLRTAIDRHISEDCVVQLGGAVGDLSDMGEKGPVIRATLAARLGLADAPCWHSSRDRIASIGVTLAQLSAACAKIGLDVALMARDGDEIVLSGGGTSSAMAHKQNPVMAEILVALGHFSAAQSGLLHHAMIGEMERSGSAWSLEWMTLPPLLAAAFASTEKTSELLSSIRSLGGDPA